MNKPSIYGFTLDQLTAWLKEHGYSRFHTEKVWDALYRERVTDFTQMTDVKEQCVQVLAEHFSIQTFKEHTRQESTDGTMKFLFKLSDENLIETVLMKHRYGLSVCVTTQVGCNIGCSFCASGLLKKIRNLTSAEIVEQLMNVQHHLDSRGQNEKVSNVVVMGIGEPLDNLENVADFLEVIKDHKGLAIGPRHITVSTSGLPEKIGEFTDRNLQVNLAVSLHAPNNELRTKIMKINKAYPIEELMPAIDYYLKSAKRKITISYIMLKGINDTKEHAIELANLLHSRRHKINVNLIPYNPVDELDEYQRSTDEAQYVFYDTLKKHDIGCSVRQEHGTDIDAACGQLRSKQTKAE